VGIVAFRAYQSFLGVDACLVLFCRFTVARGAAGLQKLVGMGKVLYITMTRNAIQFPVICLFVFVVAFETFFCGYDTQGKEKKDHNGKKASHLSHYLSILSRKQRKCKKLRRQFIF